MSLFSILVDIGARTADLEEGLNRVDTRLKEFGENVKHVVELLAVEKIVEFGESIINLGASIERASQKANVGAQAFSELAYAAKLNGVDMDSLSAAIVRMNRALSEASTGAKGPNEALSALGLTFNDLKKLAPEQQLEIIADRINKLASPADKSRAEIALFGRAGAELGPLFAEGAEGILKMRAEAQRLGASFSEETLKNLEEAHKSIERLETSFSALATTLVGKVAPALHVFLDEITNLGTGRGNSIQQGIESLSHLLESQGLLGALARNTPGLSGALERRLRDLKNQQSLQDLVVNPETLKGGFAGLLEGSAPGFQPDPLQEFHPNLQKEKIGGGTVNPAVAQYLSDTAYLQEAGGKAYDALSKTRAQLKGALADGAISVEDFDARMKAAFEQFKSAIDIEPVVVNMKKLPRILTDSENALYDFAHDVEGAMAAATHESGNLGKNFLRSLLTALEDRAIFNAIDQIGQALRNALGIGIGGTGSAFGGFLSAIFGGGGNSAAGSAAVSSYDASTGTIFGGFMAGGGPLESNKWYIAGEHGPEPVWGGGAGAFASGYGGGGSGMTFAPVYNINAPNGDQQLRAALPTLLAQTAAKSKRDMLDAFGRSGFAAPRSA